MAFRLANWDTPLWASPNRRPSRYVSDGRTVQYWSLHPMTPWAEILRFHGVTDPDEAQEWMMRPWVAELELPDGTVDIDFGNAAAHGIDPDALVDDDYSRCQHWAAARDLPAVIVPSAALPGTRNVILFGPRVRARWGITPLDRVLDVPCDPIAHLSVLVEDLLARIRWRGTPHAGFEAWRAGEAPIPPPLVTVPRLP